MLELEPGQQVSKKNAVTKDKGSEAPKPPDHTIEGQNFAFRIIQSALP